jgi:hypothetical protein
MVNLAFAQRPFRRRAMLRAAPNKKHRRKRPELPSKLIKLRERNAQWSRLGGDALRSFKQDSVLGYGSRRSGLRRRDLSRYWAGQILVKNSEKLRVLKKNRAKRARA